MPDCDKLLPLLRSEPENMERVLRGEKLGTTVNN